MVYLVEVTETLTRNVEVEADSIEDAEIQIERQYKDELIVLDSSDHEDTVITVIGEK